MTRILPLDLTSDATDSLESAAVLFFPSLPFEVRPDERVVFTPAILGSSKNASFDPAAGRVSGTQASGPESDALHRLLQRFSETAAGWVERLFPRYRGRVLRRRASFRPVEIAGRVTSWRKDDTRLHVDSFPATPTGGHRIFRVFSNVNPNGRARAWRVGDDFEPVARRFAAQLRIPFPGSGQLLAALRITKTTRTPYDALMLQLHDRMKQDADFQSRSPQTPHDFPAGSTWMCFTDEVSHAAMSGQYQLEQTFLLPVAAMTSPERSPLRVLERLKGRSLA